MKRNKDFTIREYHVVEVSINEFGGCEWEKVNTFTSLSKAIKHAHLFKALYPSGDYRVMGEFNYEEI